MLLHLSLGFALALGNNKDILLVVRFNYNITYIFVDYSIRLVNRPGHEPYEGRVEVYHGGEWKSVCDDGWGWEESDVVCKSLGYSLGAQRFYHGAHYCPGSGEILLDDVVCTGSESSLLYCKHNGIHIHNCGHHEDIGVKCAGTCIHECVYM